MSISKRSKREEYAQCLKCKFSLFCLFDDNMLIAATCRTCSARGTYLVTVAGISITATLLTKKICRRLANATCYVDGGKAEMHVRCSECIGVNDV